jgi:hypothetical protein
MIVVLSATRSRILVFITDSEPRKQRVATRLALDHPDIVIKLIVLDIAPTVRLNQKGASWPLIVIYGSA